MKLFKNIDNYLLNHYPNIWISRIHQFLPIGLIILIGIFLINVFVVGFDIRDDISYGGKAVFALTIPVLVYLVFWFVIQSRYNVEKSGGKLSVLYEYMNYFLYFLIFLVAFLILFIVPMSSAYKIKLAVNETQLLQDIDNLNLGNAVVNDRNALTFDGNKYTFQTQTYVYNWKHEYINKYEDQIISVNKEELYSIIENFIESFNKYTYEIVDIDPDEIINGKLNGFNNNNFDYNYNNSYSVKYKIGELLRINDESWIGYWYDPIGFKILFGVIALLSMLVWIYKQIHWKNYLFGIISILFSPLIFGIIGLIIFEILRFRASPGEVSLFFVFLYIIFSIKIGYSYLLSTKSNLGIVMAMYFQFFLPLLSFFVWIGFNHYGGGMSDKELFGVVYWIAWVLGLASIFVFKIIYRKMSLMPAKK